MPPENNFTPGDIVSGLEPSELVEIRRIAPFVLTGPDLDKLRQLGGRAWLYIVTFCKGEHPRLRIIQDPIPKLNPEMLSRQVQFVVQESDWSGNSEEVSLGK